MLIEQLCDRVDDVDGIRFEMSLDEQIIDLINQNAKARTVVFCSTRQSAAASALAIEQKLQMPVAQIHRAVSMEESKQIVEQLIKGQLKIVVMIGLGVRILGQCRVELVVIKGVKKYVGEGKFVHYTDSELKCMFAVSSSKVVHLVPNPKLPDELEFGFETVDGVLMLACRLLQLPKCSSKEMEMVRKLNEKYQWMKNVDNCSIARGYIGVRALLDGVSLEDDGITKQFDMESRRICKQILNIITTALKQQQKSDLNGKGYESALMLVPCLKHHMWHDSTLLVTQINGIGPSYAKMLAENAGVCSLQDLKQLSAGEIQMAVRRNPPFGLSVVSQTEKIPKLSIEMTTGSNADRFVVLVESSGLAQLIVRLDGMIVKHIKIKGTTKKTIKCKIEKESMKAVATILSLDWVGINKQVELDLTNLSKCRHQCKNKLKCKHECCKVGLNQGSMESWLIHKEYNISDQ